MTQATAPAALGGARDDNHRPDAAGHDGRATFHPQRAYPRYGVPFAAAARVPGGLRLASRALRGIAFDPAHSDTENADTDDLRAAYVVVCGFPRTGTTFIQRAINLTLGDEHACWKNHDPLAITLYADAGLPVLVTRRDPLGTVVSWSQYHHDEPSPARLVQRLALYTAWHREARRMLRSPWVTVVDFAQFCADPGALIADTLGHPRSPRATSEAIAHGVRADNHRSNRPLVHGNTPDPRRDALKAPYLEAARDRRVQAALARAMREYDALT